MKTQTITNKQLNILMLLYRFRFLNTNQIKLLMKHKEPQQIQEWLKDLKQKQYIESDYKRSKREYNTKPAVYHLMPASREILKKQETCNILALKRVYKEGLRSPSFIEKSLLIANIYLRLKLQTEEDNKKLHFSTATDLATYSYLPKLDGCIAIKSSNRTKRYFLVIFEEHWSKGVVRGKINSYLDYSQSNIWEENTNTAFPSFLIVCLNEPMKERLYKHISMQISQTPFYLVTQENIREHGLKSEIWEKVE